MYVDYQHFPDLPNKKKKERKDNGATALIMILILVVNFDLYHLYRNSNPLPLLHTMSFFPMMLVGLVFTSFFTSLRLYKDWIALCSCSLLFALNVGYFYFVHETWGALLFFFFMKIVPTVAYCDMNMEQIRNKNKAQ